MNSNAKELPSFCHHFCWFNPMKTHHFCWLKLMKTHHFCWLDPQFLMFLTNSHRTAHALGLCRSCSAASAFSVVPCPWFPTF